MKKIPTLFVRHFINERDFILTREVTPGLEWVLEGKGDATIKIDGSCTAIIDGKFYKRYDAKNGKNPPEGAIPCCEPDPVTGHWPHWLLVDPNNNADKWLYEAYKNSNGSELKDGTYEAIGPHYQRNPYNLEKDILVKHGTEIVDVERSFDGIREYLKNNYIEGLVFWKDGEPKCKIKRRDFGFPWNRINDDNKVKNIDLNKN